MPCAQLVELVRSYCHNDFSEDVVKGNFVLIYELLDEVLDFGYPQVRGEVVVRPLCHPSPCLWGGGCRLSHFHT